MTLSPAGKRRALLLIPATALALFVSGPASASIAATNGTSTPATAQPTDNVTVEVATINGSGCPAGTADVSVNSDNTAFRVTYQDYSAESGGGAAATDERKNCQLSLRFHAPSGWTFAISRVVYSGHVDLATGATALQRANYYFQGSPDNNFVDHPFTGPADMDWQNTDTAALMFGPCGVKRNLNINTELRADAGSSDPKRTSAISMRATSDRIITLYNLAWRTC